MLLIAWKGENRNGIWNDIAMLDLIFYGQPS